jgi:hypothetical protein
VLIDINTRPHTKDGAASTRLSDFVSAGWLSGLDILTASRGVYLSGDLGITFGFNLAFQSFRMNRSGGHRRWRRLPVCFSGFCCRSRNGLMDIRWRRSTRAPVRTGFEHFRRDNGRLAVLTRCKLSILLHVVATFSGSEDQVWVGGLEECWITFFIQKEICEEKGIRYPVPFEFHRCRGEKGASADKSFLVSRSRTACLQAAST